VENIPSERIEVSRVYKSWSYHEPWFGEVKLHTTPRPKLEQWMFCCKLNALAAFAV